MDRLRRILFVLRSSPIGLRLTTIARKTRIPLSTLRRDMQWLVRIGIVDLVGGRYKLPELVASMVDYLLDRYDVEVILNPKYLTILVELLEPKTYSELIRVLDISDKTLKKRLSILMERGLVRIADGKYCIVEDRIIEVLIRLLRSRLINLTTNAEVLWSKGKEKIVAVPKGTQILGTKTAFSIFPEYGIHIESPKDYYYLPPRKLSLEEIIIHSIIASRGDPYKLTLVAILLAKHYDDLDHQKLKKLAIEYGTYDQLIKLDAYIHGIEPAEADLLPMEEFEELAKLYGIDTKKLMAKTFTEDFLHELGEKISTHVTIILVGGAVMILRGYKERTKDIDIVVENEETRDLLLNTLKKMGYKLHHNKSITILEHPTKPRVDLHIKKIGKITITETIKQRAEKRRYNKLEVLLPSDTDLVLMKATAGRARDVLDIIRIMKKGKINWETLLEEMIIQEEISGQHLCIHLLNTIEIIQEKLSIRLAIHKKLRKITIEHMVKYAYEKLGLKTPKQIRKHFNFPEHAIRRILKKLEEKQKQ